MTTFGAVEAARLPSGVPLYVVTAPSSPTATIGCSIRRGPRHEPAGLLGVTHLLEHLLLRTRDTGEFSLPREIEFLGGEVNALTSNEDLFVYCRVPAEHGPAAAVHLARCLSDEELGLDGLEAERKVVLEEIRESASDPSELVHELLYQALFPGHGLGRPVAGTPEAVGALGADELLEWRRQAFTRANAGIVAVVPDAAAPSTERIRELGLEALPEGGDRDGEREAVPVRTPLPEVHVRTLPSDYAYVMLGVPGYDYGHVRRAAADVLAAALGGSTTSLLYDEIRERRGLAYSVDAWHRPFSDTGALPIMIGASPENVDEVLSAASAVLAEAASRDWSPEEFTIARNQAKGGTLLRSEDSSDHALLVSRNRHVGLCDWTVGSYVEAVDAVTVDDLRAVAAELLGTPPVAAVAGGYPA